MTEQLAKPKLTPYQRIVRAGKKGIGVRISAEEIQMICQDTAITDVAWNDDEEMGIPHD